MCSCIFWDGKIALVVFTLTKCGYNTLMIFHWNCNTGMFMCLCTSLTHSDLIHYSLLLSCFALYLQRLNLKIWLKKYHFICQSFSSNVLNKYAKMHGKLGTYNRIVYCAELNYYIHFGVDQPNSPMVTTSLCILTLVTIKIIFMFTSDSFNLKYALLLNEN